MQSPEKRLLTMHKLAENHGWSPAIINTKKFDLLVLQPNELRSTSNLTVYIEGDGLAWENRFTPSTNPTPIEPTGLKLAFKHPTNNAVYLARPCQYVMDGHSHNCDQDTWTSGRYSEPVIDATNQVINQLKHRHQSHTITLIGYSGGATVALLVAARRDDIKEIVTVAGNLDIEAWTQHHQISQLFNSLSPKDYFAQLRGVPQIHFMGENDKIIPPTITSNFINELLLVTSPSNAQIRPNVSSDRIKPFISTQIIQNFNHHCCWVDAWPQLLQPLHDKNSD